MSKTFYDPFTNTGTAIDGELTPNLVDAGKVNPWGGYKYKDARGATWQLSALDASTGKQLAVTMALGMAGLMKLLADGRKPDRWRAELAADNVYGKNAITLYNDDLALTLEDIDQAAYAKKLTDDKSGGGFGLVLLVIGGLWLLSKKKGRR